MSGVTLDSITIKTDALAALTLDSVGYTFAKLSWVNVSESEATFMVANALPGADPPSFLENVVLPAGESGSVTVTGLEPGSSDNFYLYRKEFLEFVPQTSSTSTDGVVVSTYSPSSSVSIGGESALIKWTRAYPDAKYVVTVSNDDTSLEFTESDFEEDSSSASNINLLVEGLTLGTTYNWDLKIMEPLGDEEESEISVQSTGTFTTTQGVVLEIVDVFASYVDVEWIGDDDVVYRLIDQSSGSTILNDSGRISNLSPGTSMSVELQSQEPDGSWIDQAVSSFTTPSSTLSVSGIASSSIQISWTALYDGADYTVTYTEDGGSAQEAHISDATGTVIYGLDSNTSYVINLFVEEDGELVGLSSLGMNGGVKTTINYKLYAIILVLVLLSLAAAAKFAMN